ncbi:hypothetical protein P154DRAFT_616266 [Amniculicola lignicola CBS 123094]|uniref:Uncharacterized protein n=1 Tax=Amniculicola lignicola CBS 123094 TaxID=1392246 RepID=A0A6A5WUF4_9PLEO|nr:hypothetical protein P154DRAFT_616266 [Amniculicola lignicola CBS 123094]
MKNEDGTIREGEDEYEYEVLDPPTPITPLPPYSTTWGNESWDDAKSNENSNAGTPKIGVRRVLSYDLVKERLLRKSPVWGNQSWEDVGAQSPTVGVRRVLSWDVVKGRLSAGGKMERASTWGNDVAEPRLWKRSSTRVGHMCRRCYGSLKIGATRIGQLWLRGYESSLWPSVKEFEKTDPDSQIHGKKKSQILFSWKQLLGFCIFGGLGILPLLLFGNYTRSQLGGPWMYTVFNSKTTSCGEAFGVVENATMTGTEALFALDKTMGSFKFSQAKLLDTIWDVVVGKGVQFAGFLVSYEVYSSIFLRIVEHHPATFQTFSNITLNGASWVSLWALFRDLFRIRSKRVWAIYFSLFLSIAYVLSLSTWLSAMTGYVSTTIPWVDMNDNSQIVPASSFQEGYFVTKAGNESFNNTCAASHEIGTIQSRRMAQKHDCDCMLPNGTITSYRVDPQPPYYSYYLDQYRDLDNCTFNIPNNTKTYIDPADNIILQCKDPITITLFNKKYEYDTVEYDWGYCHGETGYPYLTLKTRCLPDTANEAFKWGFSTMLAGVFLIIHTIWSILMYIIWQDAQFNSVLVKSGYRMSQLRAAFTITEASKQKTGLTAQELLGCDLGKLGKELYGSRSRRPAEIGVGMYEGVLSVGARRELELRRRRREGRGERGSGKRLRRRRTDIREEEEEV